MSFRALSRCLLDTNRHGTLTTSQGNRFQHQTTLLVKMFFLIPRKRHLPKHTPRQRGSGIAASLVFLKLQREKYTWFTRHVGEGISKMWQISYLQIGNLMSTPPLQWALTLVHVRCCPVALTLPAKVGEWNAAGGLCNTALSPAIHRYRDVECACDCLTLPGSASVLV